MTLGAYRAFQALILAGLGFFLIGKVWNGTILLYINRRFVMLVVLAGIILLLLSQVVLRTKQAMPESGGRRPGEEHAHWINRSAWALWLVSLPLLVGLLIPARPLGAAALANRGIQTEAPLLVRRGDPAAVLGLPAGQRTILDWLLAFSTSSDLTEFAGEPVDVIGFVHHDPRLSENRFWVGRFTITCCAADATAVGMTVAWPGAASLAELTWVRIQGEIGIEEQGGQPQAVIQARQVEVIPEPEQPYLFP